MFNPLMPQYLPNLFQQNPSKNAASIAPLYTVPSLQEVRMAQPNYDGSPIYFLVAQNNTIVVKQMDTNGLVVLKTYVESKEDSSADSPISTATIVEQKDNSQDIEKRLQRYIDKQLSPILQELTNLTALVSKKEEKITDVTDAKSTDAKSTDVTGNSINANGSRKQQSANVNSEQLSAIF